MVDRFGASVLSSAMRELNTGEVQPYKPQSNLQRFRWYDPSVPEEWASCRGGLSLILRHFGDVLPAFSAAVRSARPVSDNVAVKVLKYLSDQSGPMYERTHDVRYLFYNGIGTIGERRKADESEVRDMVKDWVTGPVTLWGGERRTTEVLGVRLRDYAQSWVDSFVKDWMARALTRVNHYLSWEDFLDDPTRWATSGSAPTVEYGEDKFRNKWAWAVDTMSKHGSIAKWYCKRGLDEVNSRRNVVALKEESAKVRLVLAAPISSHLRQSYIMQRLGAPQHLESTITKPSVVLNLLDQGWTSMVGLDASKFDHNVPRWLISTIFTSIARYAWDAGDRDLCRTATIERQEILASKMYYAGKKVCNYHHGVLSGWRMTSIIDSMLSQMMCDFIRDVLKIPADSIVQGDDMLLRSWGDLPASKIEDVAEQAGMLINRSKTTSGRAGEFLKYLYMPSGVAAYPCRSVRAIFWSNPWLPELVAKTPLQIANCWWTYLSRAQCFSEKPLQSDCISMAAQDLSGWSGKKQRYWREFLTTPLSIGGAAPLELALPTSSCVLTQTSLKSLTSSIPSTPLHLLGMAYGAYGSALSTPKNVVVRKISTPTPIFLRPADITLAHNVWYTSTNHWKSMLSWLGADVSALSGSTQPITDFIFPKYAKKWTVFRKIRWMLANHTLTPSKSLTSSQHFISPYTHIMRYAYTCTIFRNRFPPSRQFARMVALGLDHLQMQYASPFHSL